MMFFSIPIEMRDLFVISQSGESYFHPSMLEDPWAKLEQQRANASFARYGSSSTSEGAGEKAEKQLSDSMIPQAGQSDRNEGTCMFHRSSFRSERAFSNGI